jgi:hypothetical protein
MWSRRGIISGALSAFFLSLTKRASAAWGIFQVSGPSTLPAGVSLLAPDGGTTYFATNGFTVAASFPTSIAYTSGTVTYSAGWDSPNFIPVGGFVPNGDATMVSMYHDVNWNTVCNLQSNSVLTTLQTGGISVVPQVQEFWGAQGGTLNGLLPTNGITTGPLPACVVALAIADEPQYQSVLSAPVGGTATNADGTVPNNSGNVITNAFQSGRPWYTGWALSTFSQSQSLNISPVNSTPFFFPPLTTTYPMPSGGSRNAADMTGFDAYQISPSRYAAFWGQNSANIADGGGSLSSAFTMLQMARGTHQGVFIDWMRNWCTANLTAGFTRPIAPALSLGNGKVNIPYEISMQEFNWELWAVLIHGARYLTVFDHGDEVSYFNHTRSAGFMQGANQPQEGFLGNTDTQMNQTVTFTGVISGGVLTVTGITPATIVAASGLPGGQLLQAGMEITTINGVAQNPNCPVIQTQLTFTNEGSFTGQTDASGNLTVTGLTGVIPVPCKPIAPGTTPPNIGPSNTDAAIYQQSAGTVNGAGTYQINRGFAAVGPSAGWTAYCPGMNGTYQVSGGVAASPVTMVAKLPDVVVLGNMSGTNNGTGHIYGEVKATCARVIDLAPVINSNFAKGFVKDVLHGSSNLRYIFPVPADGTSTSVPHGYGGSSSPGPRNFMLSTGIDCCVHYYQGANYPSSSGETISTNTFYIFATTAYPEDTAKNSITCTFAVAAGSVATVIGEARTIPISGGTFSDTFQYAWTVHVYKIT